MSLFGVPAFPHGDLRSIVLHWTAGDYATTSAAYHFCIALPCGGTPAVVATHALQANMRDVRRGAQPYAAHTAGRNSHAIGIAVCGMLAAEPHDFGRYPLRDDALAAACELAASLAAFYRIALDREHLYTHAEAAVDDGYFGAGEDRRWDIARLTVDERPLQTGDARIAGDALRARTDLALRRQRA